MKKFSRQNSGNAPSASIHLDFGAATAKRARVFEPGDYRLSQRRTARTAINPKMQRKYVKKLRGITTAAAESKPSAYALLKRRAIEQEREIEQLKAKLASLQHGGSLFDLKKDKAKDIGDVIANTAIESKALAISGAIKAKNGTRTEAI